MSCTKILPLVILGFTLGLIGASLPPALPAVRACPKNVLDPEPSKSAAPAAAANQPFLADLLPSGALRRLGSVRPQLIQIVFAPDGKTLACAGHDGTIRVLEAATDKELRILRGHRGAVRSVAYTPDGKTLASAGDDHSVRLWDVGSGKELRNLQGHQADARSVTFTPDGKTLVSGSYDATVRLWDVASGKELRTLRGHAVGVLTVACAPDGKTLASAGGEPTIRLWDVASGKELRILQGHQASVWSLTYTPDGKTLASGSQDGTVRLWDAATGKDLLTLQGHEREVTSVAFAPDGKTLASASIDQTLRLWDVASGKELRKFQGHDAVVASVAYAPDGRSVCSGSYDTTILVWSVFDALAAVDNPGDLRALWTELAGDDPVRAHRAIGALIASRQLAVPFLQGQLPRPVPGPSAERLAQLIAALDHNQFAERENAERELEKLGELAAPALERALAGGPLSLEAHRRLVRLLEKLSTAASVPSKEELRWRRAIQALEQIGGADVKSVLEKLAQTGPTGRLRRDAAAALQRLGGEAKGG